MSNLNTLRNLHPDFHDGCIILHCLHQCRRVPSPPQPLQSLLLFDFLIIIILSGVIQTPNSVLIYVPLLSRNTDHLYFFFCKGSVLFSCSFHCRCSKLLSFYVVQILVLCLRKGCTIFFSYFVDRLFILLIDFLLYRHY